MKKIIDFILEEKEDFGRSSMLVLRSDVALPEIIPGQFVQVEVSKSPHSYLRRPISVHDVDTNRNTLTLLVQRVGEGTQILCDSVVGDKINIILPLGNGFTIDRKHKEVLLVGGGIGIAPLLYLAKTMNANGIRPTILLGGRTQNDLLRLDEYRRYGEVFLTTDDGSCGFKGFVSQHPIWNERHFDQVSVCGPLPMMKSVAKIANDKGFNCEVSLENLMACGLGACLCCVEKTTEGLVCVCKEGPIFNIKKLLW